MTGQAVKAIHPAILVGGEIGDILSVPALHWWWARVKSGMRSTSYWTPLHLTAWAHPGAGWKELSDGSLVYFVKQTRQSQISYEQI